MKRALITGITGQDGAYLAELLLRKKYEVYGTYRRLSTPNFWRLHALDIFEDVTLIPADLIDSASVTEALQISKPDEVYHLAAQSFVGASFSQAIATGEITGLGVTRILEAMRQVNCDARFYQASTSELFGNAVSSGSHDEETYFAPSSPYAAAKLYGYWITRIYRQGYGMYATNGILFNHESPLRGLEFVTRKISNGVAKILLGIEKVLRLGNLDAKRDWGYAPDYVESMWMMLQQRQPDDFVIATDETHSVQEFAEKAFDVAGLDWEDHVKVDKRFFRPIDVNYLRGDYSKAEKQLGWRPKVKFDELVKIMVSEDIRRWEEWSRGRTFPWDASNYPAEARVFSRSLRV